MKGKSSFEQQIRTVKYLNQHEHSESDSSQVVTERRSPSEEDYSIRINHPQKQYPKSPFFQKHVYPNVVLVQITEPLPSHKEGQRTIAQTARQKHKKGKSMDLEAFRNSQLERAIPLPQAEVLKPKGKVIVNSQFIHEFRSRNNASEMRDYHMNKKAVPSKKFSLQIPQNSKKKKSSCSSELKEPRRETKPMTNTAAILTTKRKDSTGRISNKTHKVSAAGKASKMISRSTQLFRPREKSTHAKSELINTAITMPLTSKLESLFSNTTSVFSSRTDLALQIYNQRPSCVIPTEESMDEIPEIRRYQSLVIHDMKRSSSKNLRKMSSIKLVGKVGGDMPAGETQSTHQIIDYYLNFFNTADGNQSSQKGGKEEKVEVKEREERKEERKDIKAGHYEMDGLKVPTEVPVVAPLGSSSQQVQPQQRELVKLNEIIDLIHSKPTVTKQQKHAILNKIKELLPQNQDIPKQEVHQPTIINPKPVEILPQMDLNSSLRESMTSDEEISNLNVQILDRTLRERQHYLRDRQNKQLDRLEELKEKISTQQYESEREKIIKWTQHEIKEVVHTRLQLWKGFSFAKHVLSGESNSKNEKKREMMRCLSEKYIKRAEQEEQKPLKRQKKQQRLVVLFNKSSQNSQMTSPDKLNEARFETNKISQELVDIQSYRDNEFHEEVLVLSEHQRYVEEDEEEEEEERNEPFQIGEQSPILNIEQKIERLNPKELHLFELNEQEKKEKKQRLVCEIDGDYSFNHLGTPEQEKDSPQRDILQRQVSLFKFATLSDKEDICQFIFLDLCIELTDEYSPTTPLMKKIRLFIKQAKQLSKRQKGFKTNSFGIKDYLHNLITFLKTEPELLQEIHENLDKPIGPTAIEILRYMHPSEQVNDQQMEDNVNIMHCKIFDRFQPIYLSKVPIEQYYHDEDKEKKRRVFLKNAMHVHNKAIFDCVNELLDRERLFGLWGEPFTWKKTPKFKHNRDGKMKNDAILGCAQRTIEYGTYLCGFMVDKEDCNFRDNPNVTQTYIDQIRHDRLSRMIAQELEEGEQKMLFLDDEQTQYLVELGQNLFERLVVECMEEFFRFV